jgi:hypothetical protein
MGIEREQVRRYREYDHTVDPAPTSDTVVQQKSTIYPTRSIGEECSVHKLFGKHLSFVQMSEGWSIASTKNNVYAFKNPKVANRAKKEPATQIQPWTPSSGGGESSFTIAILTAEESIKMTI